MPRWFEYPQDLTCQNNTKKAKIWADLVAVPGGGFGLGLPYLLCQGGGGATSTYMAQNDPHLVLIILTTHLWGKIFE